MLVTLDEMKLFLRLDSSEDDATVETLIQSAQDLCLNIIRKDVTAFSDDVPGLLKTAICYAVTYLYEHRDEADFHALEQTLRHLLAPMREAKF